MVISGYCSRILTRASIGISTTIPPSLISIPVSIVSIIILILKFVFQLPCEVLISLRQKCQFFYGSIKRFSVFIGNHGVKFVFMHHQKSRGSPASRHNFLQQVVQIIADGVSKYCRRLCSPQRRHFLNLHGPELMISKNPFSHSIYRHSASKRGSFLGSGPVLGLCSLLCCLSTRD